MKAHKKHGMHPHDKMAAMPQFNQGHWERDIEDVELADGAYSQAGEFGQCEDYKRDVDGLANYAKKHKMKQ